MSSPPPTYSYDDNGNVLNNTLFENITYNHLDLIESYDEDGQQSYTAGYTASGVKIEEDDTDFIGRYELVNGNISKVHYQDRFLDASSNKRNYYINDHLGNVRIVFRDDDNDKKIESIDDVVKEYHYYPFGLKLNGPWIKSGITTREQYNGIDFKKSKIYEDYSLYADVKSFGLNHATYRSLDPSIGQWLQVDPKAEMFYGLSPYNSMLNNPVSFTDPEGDCPFCVVVGVGAATGIFGNGLNNVSNGQGFFDGAGKAALWGGIGAAASFGIGAAAGGIFGQGASFGKAAFQFGAHGLSNGLQSHLQGGSFGQGFLSGGISSGIGSGIEGLGGNAGHQILGGGLGGGIGSAISGGDFFQGMTQGLIVGAFNHALHGAAENAFMKEDILPDGRMLWELSDKEFEMFHSSEGRKALFGGEFDIQLSVAERAYWFGKQLGLAMPTAKVAGFGKTMFNSKLFGYKSKWFGRYSEKFLPNGNMGKFNNKGSYIRTGWGPRKGSHTFRTAIGHKGTGVHKHFDYFTGPKY